MSLPTPMSRPRASGVRQASGAERSTERCGAWVASIHERESGAHEPAVASPRGRTRSRSA